MFECSICGLLSLNAISCPACGSQNLVDLSIADLQTDDLPTEIPGLDDAVDSWRELEGSVGDSESMSSNSINKIITDGSLPFGFSGESNVQVSRLPFGIGSHADGIPFENQPLNDRSPSATDETAANSEVEEFQKSQIEPKNPEATLSSDGDDAIPEIIITRPKVPRIQPVTESSESVEVANDSELPLSLIHISEPTRP